MQGGATEEQVAYLMLTSAPFNAQHPDNGSFVQALYTGLLGRQASAPEVASWVSALDAGVSRPTVVQDFLDASDDLSIVGDYTIFLGRVPSQSEVNSWLALLTDDGGPLSLADVAANFLGSSAYRTRVQLNL